MSNAKVKDRACAIVGAYEHPQRKALGKSNYGLLAESAHGALAEAGLSMKDVDGLCWAVSGEPSTTAGYNLADYLNIRPSVIDTTKIGGASFLSYVNHAQSLIATGKARVVLIGYGSTRASDAALQSPTPMWPKRALGLQDSFEEIYGLTTIGSYAMVAQRHIAHYGTKPEQLAQIAVAARGHAALNPHATFRDPITVEDVLESPMISSPLHRLDCCLVNDGGGAIVVAAPEVATNCATRPVWVLGCGEAVDGPRAGKGDLTVTAGAQSGPRAFAATGVTNADIDAAMIYDSFTITVLVGLEDLGFCSKGEGGSFVEGGRIALGGALPVNTDGGGLSSLHPSMRGIFTLIEGTRQLRGDFAGTPRQVPDCRIVLCHGTGGMLGAKHGAATVILGRD